MNILFTCNEFPPFPSGGLGTFVSEISQSLYQQGHNIYIYGVYPSIDSRIEENFNGVKIVRDPLSYPETKFRYLIKNRIAYARAVNSISKLYSIDIIEAHDTGGWFIFFSRKVPLFVRLHNGERYYKKRGLKITLIEAASFIFRSAHYIGTSKFILGKFTKHFRLINPLSRYSLIYNGINISYNVLNENTNKTIVFAGTLKKIKGIDVLINAFIISGLNNRGYTLHLYGKNSEISPYRTYWDYLLQTIKGLNEYILNKYIIYHGTVSKNYLIKIFADSEICVFPSHLESFGLVVIEAMSVGALTIYTKQGPASEIIDDNVDGFLVEPNNPLALSKKLVEVAEIPENKREQIKSNAKEKAKFFSIEKCTNSTISLYTAELDKYKHEK